tara:strand:+ start:2106 stop:2441 length:336 start_codon:yes stop_codon:yes gene_type:complete
MYTIYIMDKKIEFTDSALKQIKKIISRSNNGKYFRISVKGGGCSGFKYNFSFDNNVNKNDVKFRNTLIDNQSLLLIEGSIVDYKKELIGDSFVIKNPKAESSCGCGLSFSV